MLWGLAYGLQRFIYATDRLHIRTDQSLFSTFLGVTEIPSGFLADRYGALKLTFCSAFCRGSGLLLLALGNKHIFILVLSAFLTAFGDSLYSGTLTSWVVKQTKKAKLD